MLYLGNHDTTWMLAQKNASKKGHLLSIIQLTAIVNPAAQGKRKVR